MSKMKCLTAACLVLFSGTAWASNYVGGSSSNANCTITSANNWTTCRTVLVNITDVGSHGCVVTGGGDVENPIANGVPVSSPENAYRFAVTRNDTNPVINGGNERVVAFAADNSTPVAISSPVATTQAYTGLTRTNGLNGTGQHYFRLLARRGDALSVAAQFLDASMSVSCVHTP